MYLAEFKPSGAKGKAAQYEAAFVKAVAAGLAAGAGSKPVPMVVTQHANVLDDNSPPVQQWYESEGACGFAWINVCPGNSPFANWLKKNGIARKAYGGGIDIWISDFGQSVDRKSACADAMARTLQMELGMTGIYSMSRLD